MTQDLLEQFRSFFRTVGPQPDDDFVAVKNCTRCRREHKTYRCKKCDFQTWDKWKMQIHLAANARECNAVAARRAREWSRL